MSCGKIDLEKLNGKADAYQQRETEMERSDE